MLTARNVPEELVLALIAAYNRKQTDEITTGTKFHAAQHETVTNPGFPGQRTLARPNIATANATDAATALALTNEVRVLVDTHFADTIAHDSAVSAAITIATATDTTTAVTLANDLKSKFNAHRSAANVHFNNDGTNDVTNANATDATTLIALINEIKGDFNAHIASAPTGTYINVLNGG